MSQALKQEENNMAQTENNNIVYEYNVAEAIEDGVITRLGRTRNLSTTNAWTAFRDHYNDSGKEGGELYAELIELVEKHENAAKSTYERGSILKISLDLEKKTLFWLIPSELGGVTFMLPEDY
jgi:hypothetical protein